MFFENGPSYTQSDSTMISKWSSSDQNDKKRTRWHPKWSQSGCKNAARLARLELLCRKATSYVCKQWPQNDPEVIQSHRHVPEVAPKWTKMPPMWPQPAPNLTKINKMHQKYVYTYVGNAPKWLQSNPRTPKTIRKTPKWPQNGPKMTAEWLQNRSGRSLAGLI